MESENFLQKELLVSKIITKTFIIHFPGKNYFLAIDNHTYNSRKT